MSRRPATSRAGLSRTASSASVTMPPPRMPNRPPSVASQYQASHTNDGESRAGSPTRKARKVTNGSTSSKRDLGQSTGAADNGEINIQVVVRCRGRSSQEVESASPVITTTNGAISKTVTVETTPLASSSLSAFTTASAYGGGHQPTAKTYPFDKVFGPEADQTMIFNEVAENMLAEVLAGYNCTIFAYGQTGTGKTYTMQGDLELTKLNAPKTTAGIVPRVLHRLFNILEATTDTEYSVKCSYIELYNEELRDLLAPDYRGDQSGNGGLKLYEDGKKGVMIQGIEETGARNLKEALGIVGKGVQRRQTAETKLNTESSRSHTIFSITVHVKESGMQRGGEDMLRIGKFNLVDLAGSEAIGRSGATDKRAREAGMINQSLLTLGRVISALVEKGSHIPYRESKLTRLLQDSLGGRTKTCIVATVSPTRSNMEETLSTLDYAIRAKSIRNRPEVNAHLTKTGLLKEYIGDIERLKGELAATRDKNGIYIPEDQWREMQEAQQRQKSDYDEAKLKASSIEVALVTLKKEFDEVSVRLLSTADDLVRAREAERSLTEMLDETRSVLDQMKISLDEEAVVSKAYMDGEDRLDTVAGGLRDVAAESVSDVGGLFAKIARKAKVLGANADTATRFGSDLQGLSQGLRSGLAQLQSAHATFGQGVKSEMESYATKGQQATQHDLAALDKSFVSFNELAQKISASNDKGQKEASDLSRSLLAVKDELQTSVKEWSSSVSERSKSMVNDLLKHQQSHLTAVNSVLESTADLVDVIIDTTQSHISAESAAALHARDLAIQTSSAEMSRLRSQNQLLSHLLSQEKSKSAKLRSELIGNLTSMIESFTEEQDKGWTEVVDQAKLENEKGLDNMAMFERKVRGGWEEAEEKRKTFEQEAILVKERTCHQKKQGLTALDQVQSGLKERLESYGQDTVAEAAIHVGVIDGLCAKMEKGATNVAGKSSARGKKNAEIIQALSKSNSATHQACQARSSAIATSIDSLTSTILASQSSASSSFSQAQTLAEAKLDSIMSATADFLRSGIQEDVSTGITPRKKAYNVQTDWERTGAREAVLSAWRKRQGLSSQENGTDVGSSQSAEQWPVGEDEDIASSPGGSRPPSPERSISTHSSVSSREPTPTIVPPSLSLNVRIPSGLAPRGRNVKATAGKKMVGGDPVEERPMVAVLGEGGVNVPKRKGRK